MRFDEEEKLLDGFTLPYDLLKNRLIRLGVIFTDNEWKD